MAEKALTFDEFKNTLQKKDDIHVYCFCGDNEKQKQEAIQLLASYIWKTNEIHQYRIFTYFADEHFEHALSAISSPSLFGEYSLSIIKRCETITSSKKTISMVYDCIAHLHQSNYIIFDTQEYKPPEIIAQNIHHLDIPIRVVQFYKPFEESCKKYIIKKCNELALTISDDAVDALADLSGQNLKEIDEILSLIHLSGTQAITTETLEGFIINEKESLEFEFVDLFFLKDQKIWNVYSELLFRNTNQILLISLLFAHALKLEEFHLKTSQGIPPETCMKELKILWKKQKIFAQQAKIYTLDNVRKLLAVLHYYDKRIKSSRLLGFFQDNPLIELLYYNTM